MVLVKEQTNTSMEQTESPETDSLKDSQLIFDKGGLQSNGERTGFPAHDWCWNKGTSTRKKYKQTLHLSEVTSEWIKDRNVKCRTINTGEDLGDLGLVMTF